MNWLLDQLTKPQVLANGTIREPNNAMRKAADVIKQLMQLFEQDKAGRLKAENEHSQALNKLVETESLLRIAGDQLTKAERALHLKDKEIEALKYQANNLSPLLAYQEAMNEDNLRDFT